MRLSTNAHATCFSALALLLSLAIGAPAFGQTSNRAAGQEGAEVGQEILDSVELPEYSPEEGTRASGSVTLDGVGTLDLNDLAPGADREEIERLGNIEAGSAESVAEGESEFNRRVNAHGGNGEALRAFTESTVQERRGRALVDEATLTSSQAAIDGAGDGGLDGFGQCETVVDQREGDVIVSTRQVERTCSVSDQAETCGRVLDLQIERGPQTTEELASEVVTVADEVNVEVLTGDPQVLSDGMEVTFSVTSDNSDIRAVLAQPPTAGNGFTALLSVLKVGETSCAGVACDSVSGTVRIMATFEEPPTVTSRADLIGRCELEGRENNCSLAWECADDRARTVNGFRVDEAFLERFGVDPIAPGLPRLCWAARPVFTCSICAIEEDGYRNCQNAVIRGPAGNSCGGLEADAACRLRDETCLVHDVDGRTCLETARTYTCAEEVRTVVTETVTYNTCDVPAVCVGDGCRSEDQLKPASQGNAMHLAAANLAVMDTIINDRRSAEDREGGSGSGPGNGSGPGRPGTGPGSGTEKTGRTGGERDLGSDWGFDDPDGGGSTDPEQLESLNGLADPLLDEVRLFSGKAGTCKKGWAGLVQCCSKTQTDGPQRYWSIFQKLSKERQAALLSRAGGDTRSWTEILASGGEISLDSLRAGFMNNADTLQGSGADAEAHDTASIHEAFMATARSEIKPNLKPSWICHDREFDLAIQRELGMCSYAGTYCSRKILGVCLQRKESYCCYNSPMSRMLRASVDGGTLDHGNPKRPDCSGIPISRVDDIDWNAIPWDELIGRMDEGEALPTPDEQANAVERYTGSGASYGGEGRVNAVDRTEERVSAIADSRAREAIESDALRQYPAQAVIDGRGPGEVSFSPAFSLLRPGLPGVLTLSRTGTGSASVTVTLIRGSAQSAGFYSQRVSLPADGGTVNVRLNVTDPAPGEEWVFEISGAQGVAIGASPTATLRYGGS